MSFKDIPLEKLWSFIAAVIPGSAAMLIFQLSHPNAFSWYYRSTLFGYGTRLTLMFVIAFVVGNTITAALNFFAGAVGGVIGTLKRYKSSVEYDIAPWRDPRWRDLLAKRLGPELAPQNTPWISDEVFAARQKGIEFMLEEQRAAALNELVLERMRAISNDMEWRQWYDYYKRIVSEFIEEPFTWYVRTGLYANLQATGFGVLISAIFVPELRHWWYILPSSFWLLAVVAETVWAIRQLFDPWSTLTDQINYLAARG